jgi:hypothetical protein
MSTGSTFSPHEMLSVQSSFLLLLHELYERPYCCTPAHTPLSVIYSTHLTLPQQLFIYVPTWRCMQQLASTYAIPTLAYKLVIMSYLHPLYMQRHLKLTVKDQPFPTLRFCVSNRATWQSGIIFSTCSAACLSAGLNRTTEQPKGEIVTCHQGPDPSMWQRG